MSLRLFAVIRWLVLLGVGLSALAIYGGDNHLNAASDAIPQYGIALVAPTRTLVAITPTFTPTPVMPTATPTPMPTPTDLPGPSDLVPATAASGIQVIPAPLQRFIELTKDDLITEYDVDLVDIRLMGLEAFTWRDEALGCTARYDEGYTQAGTTRGYRILFSAGNRVYAYHTDNRNLFFLCEDQHWLVQEGDPIPADPIAQSMVELTARDAARQLDVPESNLQLTSLLTIYWPDSSVGCPKPEGEYDNQVTLGYRIVFRVEEQTVIYHTNIRDFVRCAPEEEILPGILRQAIPPPEPAEDE